VLGQFSASSRLLAWYSAFMVCVALAVNMRLLILPGIDMVVEASGSTTCLGWWLRCVS
jgi:hypothetical protein